MKKIISFLILTIFTSLFINAQTIIINEVSNGASGAGGEYVEFVVVGDIHCDKAPDKIDLRHWIFDDNNGLFASGSGTGIAQGACRFSNDNFWKEIPTGTLILIYDDNNKNDDVPSDDISMSDGNCRLVIPISSNLIERHETKPEIGDANYATSGWKSGGDWTHISMKNSDDSYQIRKATSINSVYHAVSYGNNTNNTIIYFEGSGKSKVFYFDNTVDNDPFNQDSWISGSTTDNENDNGDYDNNNNDQTPGRPNSAKNEKWIISLSHNCTILPSSFNISDDDTICKGETAVISANGGSSKAVYTWNQSLGEGASKNVSPSNDTKYKVTMTDNGWCLEDSVNIFVTESPVIELLSDDDCDNGKILKVSVSEGTAPYTYLWSNNENSAETSCLESGKYTLKVTDAANCSSTFAYEIKSENTDLPKLIIPTIFSPNGDNYNNTWKIENIESYGNSALDIEIYDRWGTIVFSYHGSCVSYADPINQWDGTFKGKPVEISSFVYLVSIDDKAYEQGIVSIIR